MIYNIFRQIKNSEINFVFFSLLYDKDAGHRTYTEDVYEVQARLPAGNWPASTWWTDIVSSVITRMC